jgi:hypothetical protein
MNPDRSVKVFDVLDSGFRDWTFPAFGLIFVAAGLAIAAFPALLKVLRIPFLDFQTGFRKIFRYVFLAFAVLWTAIAFSTTLSPYLRHRTLAQQNGCRVVEGPVEHFVPMPYAGHAIESFSVSGVPFGYSDFNVTDGFNNTSSHGGPISGDSYVRICYDPTSNVILRLEIRDFKGPVKDYSSWDGLFPKANDFPKTGTNKPLPSLPWYSNLFFALFFLDWVVIGMLFLPYLRTFFCIKTIPGWDRPVPQSLAPERKTKLRNSMIYWDREKHAIWLRPRGFNLIQIPFVVAKLNVDDADRSITGGEIRFSSGVPFTFVLFLWTAYRLFSTVGPAKGGELPPAVLIFFGAFAILAVVLNLRILRSRMDKLLQDAVSEFSVT